METSGYAISNLVTDLRRLFDAERQTETPFVLKLG